MNTRELLGELRGKVLDRLKPRGCTKFNQKFAPFEIVPASDPREFPEAYFLGIAAVKSPLML